MMAQEREAVEDAVVIALSKLTNLQGRLPIRENAFSRWSLLHLSSASFTEETFIETTSNSCAEIHALPSSIGPLCFDEKVDERRNTKAYRIAQKRLESHTRLSAVTVNGRSSSRSHKPSPPCSGRGKNQHTMQSYADSYQCCSCRRLTPYTCDICDDAVCELCVVDDDETLLCPWCVRHVYALALSC